MYCIYIGTYLPPQTSVSVVGFLGYYIGTAYLDTVRTLSVGVSQMTQAQAAGCDTHTPLYIFIFSIKYHIHLCTWPSNTI